MGTKNSIFNDASFPLLGQDACLDLCEASLERLSEGDFINDSHNLIICASCEENASQAAQKLCERLKRHGYMTSYLRGKHLIDLVNQSGRKKVMQGLSHYDLVCVDNVNLNSLTYLEIHQILELLEDRIMQGPILFPTPYSLSEMESLFDLFRARPIFETIVYKSIVLNCPSLALVSHAADVALDSVDPLISRAMRSYL